MASVRRSTSLRHLLRRAGAALAVLVALGLSPVPQPAEGANSGIVTAQGGGFVVNGAPFRFVGTNAYFLVDAATDGSTAHTDQMMSVANALGFTVMRTWGFLDGPSAGAALQPSGGVYNEAAFQALDYVLAKADTAGVRLIVTLVNYWGDYGGMPQYVSWCAPGSSRDAFYTNATCQQLYKNYVSHMLNRVNTLNGRRYKDDPTVFAWELANEPRSGDRTGTILTQWVATMAAYIKSIDPAHMVTTGEEGFDTTSAGYTPISTYNNQGWLFDGGVGVSFTANTADPNIDFASIHLYPDAWNFGTTAGSNWVADHIKIARQLGKPLVLGEFGYVNSPASVYEGWLKTFEAEQGDGALIWQIICQVCGAYSGVSTAYPPITAVSDLMKNYAGLANAASGGSGGGGGGEAPTFTIGTTSATPSSVAAGQSVSVATSLTAGSAASGIVVDLDVLDSSGAQVARGSFTAQTFAANQTSPYSWTWAVPSTQAAGTYTVKVSVSDSTRATTYAVANAAATLTVTAPAPTAAFTIGSTTATPNPATRGGTVAVTTNVTSAAAASGIIVDLELFNAAGTRVGQQVLSGQSFTAGQSRSFTWNWLVPAGEATGTHTVKVGVFSTNWSKLYAWANQAATFAVDTPVALSFTAGTTTATPNPVSRGQRLSVTTSATASAAASGIIVDVEVFNGSGARVGQQVLSGQSFTAGQSRSFTWKWKVPTSLATGTYTVKVGIFSGNWATLYQWNNQAATVSIQ